MRQAHWVPALAALSVVATGCGLFSQEDDTPTVVVQPAPSPQTFPSPSVTPNVSTAPRVALIQPTNPNTRLQSIRTGRNDPFAALVTPIAQPGAAPTTNTGTGTAAGNTNTNVTVTSGNVPRPGTPGASGTAIIAPPRGRTTATPGTATATATATSGVARGSNRPGSTDNAPANAGTPATSGVAPGPATSGPLGEPALPPLPQPELAKAVRVTGVVVVNGQPRAIVQAPNERVSRTVTVGDRLSNGQVVVKAIDASNRDEPIVILEQVGIDVAVGVGRPGIELASAVAPGAPIRALYSSQRLP